MGSACCVAARDRTINNGSNSDVIPRNIQYSPSWSVRWGNRRRVAGEEASMNWLSDGLGTNDRLDNKSQTTVGTAYASEEGSPLDSFRNLTWQKSSPSEGYTVPQSDQSVLKNPSELKGSREIQHASTKMSPSTHSVSSFSASPLSSSQGHFLPSSSLTPGEHLLRQVSDSQIPGRKSHNLSISEEGSPFMLGGWSNESNRGGSHGGSSDGWCVPGFSESHRERWSFDSESLNFTRDKISRCSGRGVSSSPSVDMQTCGVCSKILTEKSCWGSQKIIATNELGVVAILICGHVYHAECLENMTAEINKYDPACPVCSFGDEKALKADLALKAKKKKSRMRVVDGMFDNHHHQKHHHHHHKMSSSSNVRTPFLKRHLSFGSKGSRSLSESENNFSWKKGFFWAKSSRE